MHCKGHSHLNRDIGRSGRLGVHGPAMAEDIWDEVEPSGTHYGATASLVVPTRPAAAVPVDAVTESGST